MGQQINVIVSGSAGFKGFSISERLCKLGYNVIGIDAFKKIGDLQMQKVRVDLLKKYDNYTHLQIDIVDSKLLSDSVGKTVNKIDYIINMASEGEPLMSLDNPELYVNNNIVTTINMLELAKKYKVKKFIQSSGASIYGNTKKNPFKENHYYTKPLNPYGASKLAAENMCEIYSNQYNIDTIIFRVFSVYGPYMPLTKGITRFMSKVVNKEQISIFKGSARDYIYISDFVDAVVSSLNKRLTFQIINICSGTLTSTNDIVNYIGEYSGLSVKKKTVNPPEMDLLVSVGDNSKARKMLKFIPKINIKSGIGMTWDWYSKEISNKL